METYYLEKLGPLGKRLISNDEHIPTCQDYAKLLDALHLMAGIDYDTMRDRYGIYTYKQWFALLCEHRKHMPITYHRDPTRAEIACGYGAIHYREFEFADVLTKDGRVKKWFVAKDDGLRYYY